ncbi:MAG TPA: hypothetical protein DCZ97_10035 [Syntrophus sp. (in: bacteria)]|nr:hypothetical protein [Syntrophus sp. (in: bacteria)]
MLRKGAFDPGQLDGLELKFGDDEAALAAIEMIVHRRGFGDILARGVRETARRIGGGSDRFAMQVKGLEFPAYDPRGAFGSGLSYAVSPRGACHRRAWPPAKEILGGVPPIPSKGRGKWSGVCTPKTAFFTPCWSVICRPSSSPWPSTIMQTTLRRSRVKRFRRRIFRSWPAEPKR